MVNDGITELEKKKEPHFSCQTLNIPAIPLATIASTQKFVVHSATQQVEFTSQRA